MVNMTDHPFCVKCPRYCEACEHVKCSAIVEIAKKDNALSTHATKIVELSDEVDRLKAERNEAQILAGKAIATSEKKNMEIATFKDEIKRIKKILLEWMNDWRTTDGIQDLITRLHHEIGFNVKFEDAFFVPVAVTPAPRPDDMRAEYTQLMKNGRKRAITIKTSERPAPKPPKVPSLKESLEKYDAGGSIIDLVLEEELRKDDRKPDPKLEKFRPKSTCEHNWVQMPPPPHSLLSPIYWHCSKCHANTSENPSWKRNDEH